MTKIAVSKAKKIAMKFFGSEMTPPPFGNFLKIHPFWQKEASLNLGPNFPFKYLAQATRHAILRREVGRPIAVLSATILTFGGTFTTGGWKTIFNIYVLPVGLHVQSSF